MADMYFDVDTALAEVPVNLMPLIDDTDFKTRETAIAYNAAGMDLVWNFVTSAGAFTQTAVTPTTTGDYDWTHQGDGIYTIEIPASGGASINNDTEGYGWFSGFVTGVLPWRGPVIGFRAAAINDALCDGGDLLDVNVTQFGGTNATASGGRPEVNTSHISGDSVAADNAEAFFDGTGYAGTNNVIPTVTTVTNAVSANVTQISGDSTAADNLEAVLDGTGGVTLVASAFTLTTPITANATQISGDSTAADNLETAFDDTAGAVRWAGIVDQGTAQSATGTTLVLRAAAAFADDELIGATIQITGGSTGVGQSRLITDYVSATDTATVEAWTTTPTGTITYKIYGTAPGAAGGGLDAAGVRAAIGLASANLDTQLSTIDTVVDSILVDTAEIGAAGAGLTNINLPNQTMDIVGNITGNLSGSVGSVTGAVGSVTGAVGSVTGNVGGNVTGSVGSVVGAVGSVTGLTASDVGAIKAKTDSLAFTVAGQVDANVQSINDVTITGDGQVGTEFSV
jgi:hypothetical protein